MRIIVTVLLLTCVHALLAQDDLLNELSGEEQSAYTLATFKGTRVVNGHSVETRPEGTLEFIISHRFGTLNSGAYNLWGLDVSTIRLGLEYGITDRLSAGIGRSSFDKTYDLYGKYKLLRQLEQGFPITVTAFGSVLYNSSLTRNFPELESSDALAYAAQILIARKFSSGFSLQLAPTLVHRNTVDQAIEENTLFALGIGGRARITRSVSLNAEYYPRLNEHPDNPNFDALGFGVEIETGGHVFQLIFTNTLGMMERRMVAQTSNDFFDGGIHFGFNITRTFQLKRNP
jgi:hypothetical protein